MLRFAAILLLVADASAGGGEGSTREVDDREATFERQVRPILASRCLRCHDQGSRSKGNLQLNDRAAILQGGDRGPAAVPGDAEQSLLLKAVRRTGDLAMPPDGPLPPHELAILEEWIRSGLAWSKEVPAPPEGEEAPPWYLQPVRDPQLPSLVESANPDGPIDSFVAVARQKEGLTENPPTDRLTWLRRATFDLWGMPPTREESQRFAADLRRDAREREVDRLLASPRYSERWARHWLDLVRYAETNGHEEDSIKGNAFRYRDYVIDAFNTDLPYDQFVREQIAGDLLPPRLSMDGERVISTSASALWWLGEMMHLPFDPAEVRRVASNEIEGQIDTYGKAFLGLTVACARCHDHKFDPISMDDYYAIAGTLASSTNRQQCIESATRFARTESVHDRLEKIDKEQREILASPAAQAIARRVRREEAAKVAPRILAILRALEGSVPYDDDLRLVVQSPPDNPWWALVVPTHSRLHPFVFPFRRLLTGSEEALPRRCQSLLTRLTEKHRWFPPTTPPVEVFADFEGKDFGGWQSAGHAFGTRPVTREAQVLPGAMGEQFVSSDRGGHQETGRLVSPVFRPTGRPRYLCFFVAGGAYPRQTCVNLILHSQACPQNMPFWSVVGDGTPRFVFRYIDLGFYEDVDLFVEVVDEHAGEMGFIAVDHFFFSHTLPSEDQVLLNQVVVDALLGAGSVEEIAQRYGRLIEEAVVRVEQGRTHDTNPHWNALTDWLIGPESPLLTPEKLASMLVGQERARWDQCQVERERLTSQLSGSTLAMVSVDRPIVADARRQVSADPNELADAVARGEPPKLWQPNDRSVSGSGRLELAEWTTRPDHPLLGRVFVNRVWKHHFGRGLVPSPDNFGLLGEPCTHPDLLDYLTQRFIESGWSTKFLHRWLVTSATYGQSSEQTSAGQEKDPDNRWLHRMPIRRVEAESIRDAVLLATGNLDVRLFEGSLLLNVPNPFMIEPVQTPGVQSTERCRSIYVQVMRNHTPTLMTAFDFPQLSQTAGQRTTYSVPKQSLELLNGEFANTLAREWGEALAQDPRPAEAKMEEAYWAAFGRPPRPREIELGRQLLADQEKGYRLARGGAGEGSADPSKESAEEGRRRAWTDFAHVILNMSEFIFVR